MRETITDHTLTIFILHLIIMTVCIALCKYKSILLSANYELQISYIQTVPCTYCVTVVEKSVN